MPERVKPVLIYTTWPDTGSAQAAGRVLVTTRLAACVNILSPSLSIYEWQGELQQDTEYPMLIKTTEAKVDDVARSVREMHPFDVPAMVVLPITGGNSEFLSWIAAQVSAPAETGRTSDGGK
jgi:periplasmic divalent cation tolerance protein